MLGIKTLGPCSGVKTLGCCKAVAKSLFWESDPVEESTPIGSGDHPSVAGQDAV